MFAALFMVNESKIDLLSTPNHQLLQQPSTADAVFVTSALSPCPSSPVHHVRFSAACKDSKRALEVSQHAEDMGLILGACAGGLVVLILLLGAIVIIVKKG